jgi:hypothetical protein
LFKVESDHIPINENEKIALAQLMLHEPNLLSFIQAVCNDIQNINSHTNENFKNQIILSIQNDIIDSINNDMINIFPIVP